jgi:hypothetical protein
LGTALGGDIRGEGVESLAAYNDSGTPFRSIAGIIEDEPDGLFLRTLEQPSCGVIITPQDLLPEGYPHYPDWGIDWEDVERWEQDHEKDEGYED